MEDMFERMESIERAFRNLEPTHVDRILKDLLSVTTKLRSLSADLTEAIYHADISSWDVLRQEINLIDRATESISECVLPCILFDVPTNPNTDRTDG